MVMRFQQLGRTLLLSALVLGLNVLGVLAITHARHPHHARANVAHGHGNSLRRLSREQAGADDEQPDSPDIAVSHASRQQHWPHSASAALHAQLFDLFAYGFVESPKQAITVIATGSAPRAPGAPRGPPTA